MTSCWSRDQGVLNHVGEAEAHSRSLNSSKLLCGPPSWVMARRVLQERFVSLPA